MSESNQWLIDASHSNAGFTVKHMMITNVRGEFTKLEGKVSWDPSKPEATQIEAVIDVARDAPVRRGTVARRAGREAFGRRHLAGHVHVARGGAAPIVRTGRTLGDFDLLGVEGIARDGTEIPDAVDEDGSLRVEPAHEDRVARGCIAVLA